MQAFKRQFVSVFLMIFCLLSGQQVRAELIAINGDTKLTLLAPLKNNFSAITLVWPIDQLTQSRVFALRAGLSSTLSGGTSSRSPREIDTFLNTKGIKQTINTHGRSLLLTLTASNEVFPETLIHLENLLTESKYSQGWYERELEAVGLRNSSKARRPGEVVNEAAHFLALKPDDITVVENDGKFRFGRPGQIILRTEDQEVHRRTMRLLQKLPEAKWVIPLEKWAAALTGADERPFSLPTGVIHFADPDASEMLIVLLKAEEFEDESDQIGANLLTDYIGGHEGSEMFRIIRQEMRAAYSPRSGFVVMEKNKSVISMSATVKAEKWPEIHAAIGDIYEKVRAGKVDRVGLGIQHNRLRESYLTSFFNEPVWGALHYLSEHPEGVIGAIEMPLFDALDISSADEIAANSQEHLPPFEDFLLVLIGGGPAPSEALKSKGYCALPKNTPLRYCLDRLSNASN